MVICLLTFVFKGDDKLRENDLARVRLYAHVVVQTGGYMLASVGGFVGPCFDIYASVCLIQVVVKMELKEVI